MKFAFSKARKSAPHSNRVNWIKNQKSPGKTPLRQKKIKSVQVKVSGLKMRNECFTKTRWLKRKTMKSRFAPALKGIALWCRKHRHKPIREQYEKLCQKVLGHYAYYGFSGNLQALKRFGAGVLEVWLKWLRRRSKRHTLYGKRAEVFKIWKTCRSVQGALLSAESQDID